MATRKISGCHLRCAILALAQIEDLARRTLTRSSQDPVWEFFHIVGCIKIFGNSVDLHYAFIQRSFLQKRCEVIVLIDTVLIDTEGPEVYFQF